ncbi:Enoyl-CoA hydratase/carnithine racemase [Chelatococcus sambhunathii]|uniref:Enoyl-CoA hydratase n=2 Tax=Chelatococcus TaxID=28209 RepID=A0AAC9JP59_9HYPH|nr:MULTISPECIES: enoyl-CoA hydratase-related protein [Chelatococcus]APF37064.1 enoyl-CoA hydratase [Chelatococcus daeguensis]CUA87917.1 Enoyl-CoA hydratase/carnithine racemase [Chelatococcus sambhunathii]
MDDSPIIFARAEGIASIRFNRPQVLNALDEAMVAALRAAVETAARDERVRVVVISGEGRGFMAGGDVSRFHAAGPEAPALVQRLIEPFHEAVARLAEMPKPVIASLHGPVAGAGLSIALLADLAIAADDAQFTLAYARIGASPDGSATWSLPRVVGLRKALELALLADTVDATEALRLNLVNRVVPRERLEAETEALATRLAAGPALAYARIKRLMRTSLDRDLPAQLAEEASAFTTCAASADFAEGVSAFVAKRAPRFTGR